MPEKIHVVGHKNPDTDSICSAIAFARLKERLGIEHVVSYRAGKLNRETEFVLDYFSVPVPEYLPDLHIRVNDLLTGGVPTVHPGTSLQEAWLALKEKAQKTLPVVDKANRMLGMITIDDIAETYIGTMGILDFGALQVAVKNVVQTLKGTLLAGDEDEELRGRVYVGAMHHQTLLEVVEPGNILILGNRPETQKTAIRLGVSALILTGGAVLAEDLLQEAKRKQLIVISVKMDTFTAARLLPMSIPIESIMKTEEIIWFHDDELISEVKKKMLETRYRNYPVLDDEDRVVGLISRYDLLSMSRKKVILVDHNEWGHAVTGADQAQILEIIDHHRVGGIQTGEPIVFRNEPVGATGTLVCQCYRERGLTPEKEIAGILLAAILSDTVLFKSPTCTEIDRETAVYLESICDVNAISFGTEMFMASSNIIDHTSQELIEKDLKTFSLGGEKVGIGQVSVMGSEGLNKIREDLKQQLELLRVRQGMRYLLLMITDLLTESTELFVTGKDPEEVAKAFGKTLHKGSINLPGVLSRKKQVVPPLSRLF
ncbi:MAG: putative manganese-dependent inorganic diphosphatase [Desulfitobacteriaceae bacterium]